MPETFTLSDKQLKKINKWINKKGFHKMGTIGGRYSYCFSPTSLGVVIKVKDSLSGDELDVTDYHEW